MGILRRLGSLLGFAKDEPHGGGDEDDDDRTAKSVPRRRTRGFSVQVPTPSPAAAASATSAADKPSNGPVLLPCNLGEGGVQGFRWYGRRLKIDEDGDVADEFLDEVPQKDRSGSHEHRSLPRFKVKYNTRPAPVRKQEIAINGNVHASMEYRGMLRWV